MGIHNSKKDDRWLAYALATAHHETDRTFRGIEEYGKGKNKEYGKTDPQTGKAYYGRGLVQLTWRKNYKKMGGLLGVDLEHRPEKALDLKIATQILFVGMTRRTFTGKKLADYFNAATEDWVNARRIVNGRTGQSDRGLWQAILRRDQLYDRVEAGSAASLRKQFSWSA